MAVRAVGLAMFVGLLAVATGCDSSRSSAGTVPSRARPSSQCQYLSAEEAGKILGVTVPATVQGRPREICSYGGGPSTGAIAPMLSFGVIPHPDRRQPPARLPVKDGALKASARRVAFSVPGRPARAWFTPPPEGIESQPGQVTNIVFWTPGYTGGVGAVGTPDDLAIALEAASAIVADLPATSD